MIPHRKVTMIHKLPFPVYPIFFSGKRQFIRLKQKYKGATKMEKAQVVEQIERVLASCKIWDEYVGKLWTLFGENSEFYSEEIINFSIMNIFDTIVAIRGFEEISGEFTAFEEILYEVALRPREYKTAEDIYNLFTNSEKIMVLCKDFI